MKESFLGHVPKDQSPWNSRSELPAPPKEVFERLIKNSRVDSPKNPYASQASFANAILNRNAIIFDLLSEGLRAGELLGLKLEDIDYASGRIVIKARDTDPEDRRARKAETKTLGRRLRLPQPLLKQISSYQRKYRRNSARGKVHSFLLVAHRPGPYLGRPLSYSGLTAVLKKYLGTEDHYFEAIKLHGFRYADNEKFSELIDTHNALAEKGIGDRKVISHAEEKELRKRRYGWSSCVASATVVPNDLIH